MSARKSFLRCVETNRTIELPPNKPKIIGRNPETEIADPTLSKKQLECVAEPENCLVKITPTGRNLSGINGYTVVKGQTYSLGHGHIVELLLGTYLYEVVFDPPPAGFDEDESGPAAKKPKLDLRFDKGKWENIDNELLIFTPDNIEARPKIAAFDIDGTIIRTKSGKKFPVDFKDWVLNYKRVPVELQKLHGKGYKLVFFTNQLKMGRTSNETRDFKKKIEEILKILPAPVQVFVSLGRGIYRKPLPGMWNILKDKKNDGVDISLSDSFFVGDAAGRTHSNNKKDHSTVDRLFAKNVGLTFLTPEEYFLKAMPLSFKMPEFDPTSLVTAQYPDFDYAKPNVILMVGLPASGKSSFCKKVLMPKGYVYINRDTLGSWQKCCKALEEALSAKKSCVIDNTNVDKESRKRFIEIAKKFNVDCRCFVMTSDINHIKHNNKFRELTDTTHVTLADKVIYGMRKNYQEPEMSEGFKEIVHVPFVPQFDNDEHANLYKMFLLEK